MRKTLLVILAGMLFCAGPAFGNKAALGPKLELQLSRLGPDKELAVIVSLADKVDPASFRGMDKGARRERLVRALKSKAASTQPPIRAFLQKQGAKRITRLWAINGIAAKAQARVIEALAKNPLIESIRLDGLLKKPSPTVAAISTPEWNLELIGAPDLWNLGYTGSGTVISVMDTGVDVNHNDLSDRWRGGDNSWYDPNGEHTSPYDSTGHGTQVTGVILGGSADGTFIGVAPDARWIAVKIFNDAGWASYSAIHQGFQWLLDPDNDPETNDAPDVVNNSWGLTDALDICVEEFQEDIKVLKAAEIGVIFSAGNAGPEPYTSMSPANYPESLSVGAVNEDYSIASFSSRGPASCDGGIYPNLTAPGVSIKTTDLTSGGIVSPYTYVSGTSFASSHVAGAMSLLISAFPESGISELEQALTDSTLDLGQSGPDDEYGYGLLDVSEAYNLLESGAGYCSDSDGDGFFAEENCGTPVDCDDTDETIFPDASEIEDDGIDQDCNGYDLTINILTALYDKKKDFLDVSASSELNQDAALELVGYGEMKWRRKEGIWEITVRHLGGDPGEITVSGIEGSVSSPTSQK